MGTTYVWQITFDDGNGEAGDCHFWGDISDFVPTDADPVYSIELVRSVWDEWTGDEWDDLRDREYCEIDLDKLEMPATFDGGYWKIPTKYAKQFRRWRYRMLMHRGELDIVFGFVSPIPGSGTRPCHATFDDDPKTVCGRPIGAEWEYDGDWGSGPECRNCRKVLGI